MEARQLRTQLRGALWKGPPRCAVAGKEAWPPKDTKLATETVYGAKGCFCGKTRKWCSTSGVQY